MNPTASASDPPSLAALHPDILLTHILPRLDGPALASASCTSSHLHSLTSSSDDHHHLWSSLSSSSWPSTSLPLVSRLISTFPSSHRSFFSDAYPLLLLDPSSPDSPPSSLSLISAVDVRYMGDLVLSRAHETETASPWFTSSPFRLDLLGQNESVPTPIRAPPAAEKTTGDDLDVDGGWLGHLERNLTLSWILIDPGTKRAATVARGRPVSVQRHWLTGEVQARYATVIQGGGRRGSAEEAVCVVATVTCCPAAEGGADAVDVREVSLQVEDMEGRVVCGGASVRAIAAAMAGGRRSRGEGEEEMGGRRYEEFEVMKRRCRERRQRRERLLDLACISVGVTLFVAFWSFVLFR